VTSNRLALPDHVRVVLFGPAHLKLAAPPAEAQHLFDKRAGVAALGYSS